MATTEFDLEELIAAVVQLRLSVSTATANEMHGMLIADETWKDVPLSLVRKACSKAAKQAAQSVPPQPPAADHAVSTRWKGQVYFADKRKAGMLNSRDRVVEHLRAKYLELLLRNDTQGKVPAELTMGGGPGGVAIDAGWVHCSDSSKTAYEREAARLNNATMLPRLKLDGGGVYQLVGCEIFCAHTIDMGQEVLATWGWEYWMERSRLHAVGERTLTYGPPVRPQKKAPIFNSDCCFACGTRAADGCKLQACGRCVDEKLASKAYFCSKECLKAAWPEHKKWHQKLADVAKAHSAGCISSQRSIVVDDAADEYTLRVKRGEKLNAERDFRKAVKSLQKAIDLDATRPDAFIELAISHELSGDLRAALAASNKAFQLAEPKSSSWMDAACQSTTLCLKDGSHLEPLEARRRKIMPDTPGWMTSGQALAEIGDVIVTARPIDAAGWAIKAFAEYQRASHGLLPLRPAAREEGLRCLNKAMALASSDEHKSLYESLAISFEELQMPSAETAIQDRLTPAVNIAGSHDTGFYEIA